MKKITEYKPKGGLDHTAKFFLALCDINHDSTKGHVERVALLSEATAKVLRKDLKEQNNSILSLSTLQQLRDLCG